LFERVCGNSHPPIRAANGARVFGAQVILAHVHAAGARKQRNVRTVIHDQPDATRTKSARKSPGNFEKLARRSRLIAVLNQLDPGSCQCFGQI
jgi:hypothetical protein